MPISTRQAKEVMTQIKTWADENKLPVEKLKDLLTRLAPIQGNWSYTESIGSLLKLVNGELPKTGLADELEGKYGILGGMEKCPMCGMSSKAKRAETPAPTEIKPAIRVTGGTAITAGDAAGRIDYEVARAVKDPDEGRKMHTFVEVRGLPVLLSLRSVRVDHDSRGPFLVLSTRE